jgi:hypothetical protein
MRVWRDLSQSGEKKKRALKRWHHLLATRTLEAKAASGTNSAAFSTDTTCLSVFDESGSDGFTKGSGKLTPAFLSSSRRLAACSIRLTMHPLSGARSQHRERDDACNINNDEAAKSAQK